MWPELERAECLARGAALKWASGVFCRPEHLERLGQYRKRESQRTASIHSRLKVSSDHYFRSIRKPLKSLDRNLNDLKMSAKKSSAHLHF